MVKKKDATIFYLIKKINNGKKIKKKETIKKNCIEMKRKSF